MNVIEVVVVLMIFAAIVGGVFIQPYFESKVFNDCTGSNTTIVDAMFANLRVEDCNK